MAPGANPAGSPVDFSHVHYPRETTECAACHVEGTWQLPIAGSRPSVLQEMSCSEDPSADTDSYCTSPFWTMTGSIEVPPETAACTACHDAPYVAAHAATNTTLLGAEACATCHSPGSMYDIDLYHRP